jgi:hypothetical protein
MHMLGSHCAWYLGHLPRFLPGYYIHFVLALDPCHFPTAALHFRVCLSAPVHPHPTHEMFILLPDVMLINPRTHDNDYCCMLSSLRCKQHVVSRVYLRASCCRIRSTIQLSGQLYCCRIRSTTFVLSCQQVTVRDVTGADKLACRR